LILAYPGGKKDEIENYINNTSGCNVTTSCVGNWKVTDLIKTIITKQYGTQ
jgi:hypothetical protein